MLEEDRNSQIFSQEISYYLESIILGQGGIKPRTLEMIR